MDMLKKSKKQLQTNLEAAAQETGKTKAELKSFYRDHVEFVVKERLREFQKHLDTAKLNFCGEVREREKAIAESAKNYVLNLDKKHVQEVKLLEDRYGEQMHLYKLHFTHSKERCAQLDMSIILPENCTDSWRHSGTKRLGLSVKEWQTLDTILKLLSSTTSIYSSQNRTDV